MGVRACQVAQVWGFGGGVGCFWGWGEKRVDLLAICSQVLGGFA